MFLVGQNPANPNPIGSMYGIYANIGGILMVNVTIYTIHGSYGNGCMSNRILCQSHSMEPSIHQWDFLTFTDSMAIFSDEFLHK